MKRKSTVLAALAGASLVVGVAVVAACSSSSASAAGGCNTNPWQCPTGQTCWVQTCECPAGVQCDSTTCTPSFACAASITGKQVDSMCINSLGDPTCGDGQTCIELSAGNGLCEAFCDAQHACPSGFGCFEYGVGKAGNFVHACTRLPVDIDGSAPPPPPDVDGGTEDAPPVQIIGDVGPGGKPA